MHDFFTFLHSYRWRHRVSHQIVTGTASHPFTVGPIKRQPVLPPCLQRVSHTYRFGSFCDEWFDHLRLTVHWHLSWQVLSSRNVRLLPIFNDASPRDEFLPNTEICRESRGNRFLSLSWTAWRANLPARAIAASSASPPPTPSTLPFRTRHYPPVRSRPSSSRWLPASVCCPTHLPQSSRYDCQWCRCHPRSSFPLFKSSASSSSSPNLLFLQPTRASPCWPLSPMLRRDRGDATAQATASTLTFATSKDARGVYCSRCQFHGPWGARCRLPRLVSGAAITHAQRKVSLFGLQIYLRHMQSGPLCEIGIISRYIFFTQELWAGFWIRNVPCSLRIDNIDRTTWGKSS